MFKELLDALTTKFEGVNAAVLSRIAHKLEATAKTPEEVKTAVEGVTIQQVIDNEGDRRATDAQKTAVANYEKKHGLKSGKPISDNTDQGGDGDQPTPKPANPKDGSDSVPDYVKQILESNKRLSERLDTMERNRTATSRREQLQSITKTIPDYLQKPYELADVASLSEEDFANLIANVQKQVGEISDNLNAEGVVFGRPTAGGSGLNPKELSKADLEAINHRTGTQEEGAQPF